MTRRRNVRTNLDAELEQELAAREEGQPAGQVPTPAPAPIAEQSGVTAETLSAPASRTAPLLASTPGASQPSAPVESRAHLVKHRAPRADAVEDQFENVYQRETYYIDRAYFPKLKQLIKDSGNTKTALMNEALDLLFAKYGVQ